MIDNFSLGLTHALLLYAAWRLMRRPDIDDDSAGPDADDTPPIAHGWGRR
jgi:hypothetical protein